jgi:hypothetical protein
MLYHLRIIVYRTYSENSISLHRLDKSRQLYVHKYNESFQ